MAKTLLEATSLKWVAASSSNKYSYEHKNFPSCPAQVHHSLSFPLPASLTGTLLLKPEQTKRIGYVTMAAAKQGADTAVGPATWKMPDSKGVGPETVEQVTPRDVWDWQIGTHWKHWHGLWINYQPDKSKEVQREYKSVRSLQFVDPERTKYFHRNQWYDTKGYGPNMNWEYGPWHFSIEKDLKPDGILHPSSVDHRVLLFPSGNLGWIQMYLKPKDPKCVIFSEPMFYANSNQRMAVPVGYDSEGNLGVALLLEEVKDKEEKMDSSWTGTLWKHDRSPLVEFREEPKGVFRGQEESITPKLVWSRREAVWQGFKGGLSEEEAAGYTLVYLPNNVTVFTPKKAAVGKEFAFYITWVESDTRVRVMSVAYGADLNLTYIKSGIYDKIE